jgi:streptomycin 6-kinase
MPGDSLVQLSTSGRDDEATSILADVIRRMSAGATHCDAPSAADWGRSFATYEASGDTRIPRDLGADAANMFARLCASQANTRLLHGDLQHSNVVRDDTRGWLAIDPKGIIAEVEYEIGAVLRNPAERPSIFLDPATTERRVDRFAATLGLDAQRILQWGFAQAVLSAVWAVEDGQFEANYPALKLAGLLERLLSP